MADMIGYLNLRIEQKVAFKFAIQWQVSIDGCDLCFRVWETMQPSIKCKGVAKTKASHGKTLFLYIVDSLFLFAAEDPTSSWIG